MKKTLYFISILTATQLTAQETPREPGHTDNNKFSQMYSEMATPNMFRTASGAPGPAYYQQQADYKIDVELDDENTKLYGTETVTYHNNAPEPLEYLWVQLDQNRRASDSKSPLTNSEGMNKSYSTQGFTRTYLEESFDGGFKIEYVKDAKGKPMNYTVNQTMMRIDLPEPLKPGKKISFSIK